MRILIAILFVLFIWLQYRLWVGEGSLAEVYNLRNEIERQQRQLTTLVQRNEILEAEIRDLKNGMEALEERARTELGMIRDGEVYYQVLEGKPQPAVPGNDR
jgi:cell division protein FtsB